MRGDEPLYFGPVDRSCFGWLHLPEHKRAAVGLVVCNPFGYEAECSHRAIRHLAQMACALGMPVVRFDYDGTGDSAGDDRDSARWDAWLRSTDQAVDVLRQRTGVTRVCLLGIRLGAALATECASHRDDIAGVITIAPVVTGRHWLREIKALQGTMAMSKGDTGVGAHDGELESVGIVLNGETQVSIAALNLHGLRRAPAPDMLILDRNDRPPDTKWHDQLTSLGVSVEQHTVPGFVEMMLDPHESVVPAEMLDHIKRWLAARITRQVDDIASRGGAASRHSGQVAPDINESGVFLDADQTLFGIVSVGSNAPSPKRAVLLLNSGAIHHVGHGRMYVRFARHWASRGLLVLRADLSGLGDSLPRSGHSENDVYSAAAAEDIECMLTYLRETWGVEKVEAVGICSGAYHAFKAAVAGKALDGITVINPLTFFWKEGMSLAYPAYRVSQAAAQYRTSVWRIEKWKKFLRGQVDLRELIHIMGRRLAIIANGWLRNAARTIGRPFPEDIGVELESVTSRKVALRFVFAAGDPGEDLLRIGAGRTLTRLSRKGRLSLQRIDGPDHSFSAKWMQCALLSTIERAIKGG